MELLARQAAELEARCRPAVQPGNAFVGRDRELAELEAALAAARAGRGSVALIGGEPGIGKTRLASEVADLAAGRGVPVAWGRCPENGAPPYWPWTQVLRLLSIDVDVVAPLLGTPSDEPDEGARFRLLDSAACALSASGPAVIVFDDAQWADAASLDILTHLAGSLADSAVLVVVTYRDVEVVKGHPLKAASASERARVGVTRTIRSAIARIAEAHPVLGAHLDMTVRTGTYCAYEPDPRVPITWQL